MAEWKQKRFWTTVSVEGEADGFSILLDGRRVKTPAKASLQVPSQRMAELIAAEWEAQEEVVNPNLMPNTRSANAAIDKVAIQHTEVADMLAGYGDSDLLCYRADSPAELVERQAAAWDPALHWAADVLGARLEPRAGVLHVPQDPEALNILSKRTHAFNNFELAAFHDLVSLSGSLVLGFAAALDWQPVDDVWSMSRIDENWQEEQWGVDEEAAETVALKKADFLHAKCFFDACSD
ncbi:Chaperone required for the assembly of the F1-ATPase [Epibacterium ulvae]|uniref:Chaperone required for the assembly of the F1-ATPase n=1 Tax=Epibacterium ulvae TaxID=1156985 RepID=A0A1G5RJ50_9RHOB|nr:ATP12 family protein [Epibacterium ulvae]SCZ73830.1 Chaperone required for the assembly of the F1-ATPase [Epibacterium ulvae]